MLAPLGGVGYHTVAAAITNVMETSFVAFMEER